MIGTDEFVATFSTSTAAITRSSWRVSAKTANRNLSRDELGLCAALEKISPSNNFRKST
jgi:hypothetical protein